MSTNTIIYGSSDDCIDLEGRIYEEFNEFNASNSLLEFSDGTRLRVDYGLTWKFKVEHAGPAFLGIEECPKDDDDNYSDKVTMGPVDWARYITSDGSIQRAYATNVKNPLLELQRIIDRSSDAANAVLDYIEKHYQPKSAA